MSDWPTDSKSRIELAFSDKLKMPEDFYEFYEFCLTLNRGNPLDALVTTCGLKLVGPFEFLLTPIERKAQNDAGNKSNCLFNCLWEKFGHNFGIGGGYINNISKVIQVL